MQEYPVSDSGCPGKHVYDAICKPWATRRKPCGPPALSVNIAREKGEQRRHKKEVARMCVTAGSHPHERQNEAQSESQSNRQKDGHDGGVEIACRVAHSSL